MFLGSLQLEGSGEEELRQDFAARRGSKGEGGRTTSTIVFAQVGVAKVVAGETGPAYYGDVSLAPEYEAVSCLRSSPVHSRHIEPETRVATVTMIEKGARTLSGLSLPGSWRRLARRHRI